MSDQIAKLRKACEHAEAFLSNKPLIIKAAYYGAEVNRLVKGSHDIQEDDAEERYFVGVVLEPTDGSDGRPIIPDTDGDVYSPEEVRRAAHWYMENGRNIGYLHGAKYGGFIMGPDDERVSVLESWITPVDIPKGTYGDRHDQEIKKGTWLFAGRANSDQIWAEIKDGKLNGLSMGGYAKRRPVN